VTLDVLQLDVRVRAHRRLEVREQRLHLGGAHAGAQARAEVHGGRLAQRDDRGAQHHAVGHEDRAPAARERGVEEAERRDPSLHGIAEGAVLEVDAVAEPERLGGEQHRARARRARSLACCASWRARTVSSSGAVDSGERLRAQNLIAPSR
jgi:hypothetical protein